MRGSNVATTNITGFKAHGNHDDDRTTRPCWVCTLSACIVNADYGDLVRTSSCMNERPRTLVVSTFNGGRVCFIAYRRNFSGYETQIRENPLLHNDENVISANAPTSEISLLNARTRTSSINNYSLSLDSNTIYNRRRRQSYSARYTAITFRRRPLYTCCAPGKAFIPRTRRFSFSHPVVFGCTHTDLLRTHRHRGRRYIGEEKEEEGG